jgi:L-asparaginase / beta-aspartyl-peptidase
MEMPPMPIFVRSLLILLGALTMTMPAAAQTPASDQRPAWRLVIHGGAGVIERARLTPDQDRAIRAALDRALAAGSAILDRGGSALDAVEAAVRVLEDDPNFNAGRGAVFTYEGTIEHDAAIMNGETRAAGAITGTTTTRNPITLARRVMENSPHVFLRGLGADQFSREQGLEQVPNEWFHTPERRRQWEEFRARPAAEAFDIDLKYGTVGAVALDRDGHVAAATSTGGLTGKRWGRIGDSPIIGAGTYADDRACAVSATGAGEYFIRLGVAHEICAQLRFRFRQEIDAAQAEVPRDPDGSPAYIVHASEFELSPQITQEVVDGVIAELGELGGTGGVIVATPWGFGGWSFNTPGMYRGQASPAGRSVAIYGDE